MVVEESDDFLHGSQLTKKSKIIRPINFEKLIYTVEIISDSSPGILTSLVHDSKVIQNFNDIQTDP